MNVSIRESTIVLYDGECNLCHHAVQFIIPRDPSAKFRFASLESNIGRQLLQEHGLSEVCDTVVVIDRGRAFLRSSAALRIARYLRAPWPVFGLFAVIPPKLRDWIYHHIARNRYRWFGYRTHCMLPSPEIRERFIDI